MKEPKETIQAPEPGITTAEIPASTAVGNDTTTPAVKPNKPITTDSVPIPMLPPRKRLKASRIERSTGNTDSRIAAVDERSHVEGKCESDDLGKSEQPSVIQPDVTNCETASVSRATTANSGTVASPASADLLVVTDSNKDLFAPICVPWQPERPTPFQQEPARRGRKSRQTTSRTMATNRQSDTVCENWTASGDLGIVAPTVVSAPTPNVIHIPDDARVFQTEDGMVIVGHSDGTVQIHGHTEGQPIPIDAIRSLLTLDAAGDQTLYAVGDQITQEASYSPYSQSLPLTSPVSGYEAVDQIVGADGTQNVIAFDGSQHLAMDGSQALMAYDPNTQSLVHIDPGQAFLTLADGSSLVAVDGAQPMLSIDGGCQAEQTLVANSAFLQLLPNNNKQ